MNIKNILLICCVTSIISDIKSSANEPQKDTLSWLTQTVKKSPNDIFCDTKITEDLDHYIQLLEQKIDLLEDKIKQSPITMEELNKIRILYVTKAILSGSAACLMFLYKDALYKLDLFSFDKLCLDLLFCAFTVTRTISLRNSVELLEQQKTYTANLNTELDYNKQLLATLQLLQKCGYVHLNNNV
ncbi:MAG: hypothetical protein M1114_01755 [Candidatus Dependentiae bacterium]|nr:hypothetical protein [Candidatus Dependentiae bacterium]